MPATTDRGDVIHLAGARRLSPALLRGAPALVGVGESTSERCGWASFFRALSAQRLAVGWDPGEGGEVRMVARAEARRDPPHRPSFAHALAQSREFVAALRGRGTT